MYKNSHGIMNFNLIIIWLTKNFHEKSVSMHLKMVLNKGYDWVHFEHCKISRVNSVNSSKSYGLTIITLITTVACYGM